MYEVLKKKYGQNFLVDKNIVNKICNLIPKEKLKIIEIGPGAGALTKSVLNLNPSSLILIEIDKDLIPKLSLQFKDQKNLEIINQDVLKYNFDDHIDLIISNLPYNISSQIMVNLCLLPKKPEFLIFMFQKEFALRLLEKKLNSLNSLVNCFFEIKNYFHVSKNCFRPIPKVNSTVLFFKKRKSPLLLNAEINCYVNFKRDIFSHKRKTLNYSLKKYNFPKNSFDLSLRVEEITLIELIYLFRKINL